MNGKALVMAVTVLAVTSISFSISPHCQIPCGIYDDAVRFTLMFEHVKTIERSMKEIKRISNSKTPNQNQLVRWVRNKETHANKLVEIVTFYFMAQRVKPVDKKDEAAYRKYTDQIILLHQMIFYTMKTRQTTNLEHCGKLRALIEEFKTLYAG